MFCSSFFVHSGKANLGFGNILCGWAVIIFGTDMLAMWVIQRVTEKLHDTESEFLKERLWWVGPIILSAIFASFTAFGIAFFSPTVHWMRKVPVVITIDVFTAWLYKKTKVSITADVERHITERTPRARSKTGGSEIIAP